MNRSNTGVGLGLALLERGADDRGQVADVLGDQEIVLHEAFDVGLARRGSNSRAARAIGRWTSKLRRSSARPARKCSRQRTDQRNSSQRRNSANSRGENTPAATRSCGFCTR